MQIILLKHMRINATWLMVESVTCVCIAFHKNLSGELKKKDKKKKRKICNLKIFLSYYASEAFFFLSLSSTSNCQKALSFYPSNHLMLKFGIVAVLWGDHCISGGKGEYVRGMLLHAGLFRGDLRGEINTHGKQMLQSQANSPVSASPWWCRLWHAVSLLQNF